MRIDDRLFGALVCLLGIAVLWHSAGFPAVAGQFYGPAMFPTLIGWGFVIGGGVLTGAGLRKSGFAGTWLAFPDWRGSRRGLAGVALMGASIGAFIFVGDRVGFQLLAFATLTLMYLTAGRSLVRSVATGLVVTLGLDLLFSKLLRVPLPSGWLAELPWW